MEKNRPLFENLTADSRLPVSAIQSAPTFRLLPLLMKISGGFFK
jgi:hypothetical protein